MNLSSVFRLAVLVGLFGLAMAGNSARAQFYLTSERSQPANKIFVEAFGSAGIYSVNYERTVLGGISARVGASVLPSFSREYTTYVIAPLGVSYLVGAGGHHLELGASAATWVAGGPREQQGTLVQPEIREIAGVAYVPGLLFGYRYQDPSGGFLYRITYTPLHRKTEGWIFTGGMTVGYAF